MNICQVSVLRIVSSKSLVTIACWIDSGEGILPHTDGERYEPFVMTVSLLSSTILRFMERLGTDEIGQRKAREVARFALEPGSLFVFTGALYDQCLHGIDAVFEEEVGEIANRSLCGTPSLLQSKRMVRGKRVSLTFRIERE